MEPSSSLSVSKSSVDSGSGLHVCSFCGKSFTRREYLSCHVTAHKFPALECDTCHRQYGRVDSLRRHRCQAAVSNSLTSPVIRPRHKCPGCQKTYSRRETLLQHIVRYHQDLLDDCSGQSKAIEAHPCPVCHRVFASALSLQNHRLLIHGVTSQADDVGFSCGRCGRHFASQLNVDRHLCPNTPRKQRLNDSLAVPSEQQTLPEQSDKDDSHCLNVDRHLHQNSAQQDYIDTRQEPSAAETESQCLYDVDDDTAMLQQCDTETVVIRKSTCEFCGRTFSGSGWLRRHVSTVHGNEQSCNDVSSPVDRSRGSMGHVCPICGKSLSSVGNLNKHLLTHGPRRETCPQCGRQFHQHATLRQHLRDVHAPPGSFAVECPTCGLRMRSRNSLYSHIARFHPTSSSSPVPRHVCGICGREFHQRGNLHKHEQTHSADALYFCPDCPRRLRSAERLRRHQTWHQQGAEFACADCGHCFVQPSDLRRHIAFRHSAENSTYRCCYCGVCCRHYQMMRRHLQRRHSDQVIWQTTDIRSFIQTLAIQTMKQLGGQITQDLTAASSDDIQDIQETEVPLTIGDEDEAELQSCLLFVDSSCLENCIE